MPCAAWAHFAMVNKVEVRVRVKFDRFKVKSPAIYKLECIALDRRLIQYNCFVRHCRFENSHANCVMQAFSISLISKCFPLAPEMLLHLHFSNITPYVTETISIFPPFCTDVCSLTPLQGVIYSFK